MTVDSQRIDKWLWYARFLKTRTAAGKYVADGKVRVNRARVSKPGHKVCAGDVLTFTLRRRLRIIKVMAPGSRRGPAEEARGLYEDLTPAPPDNSAESAADMSPAPARRASGTGRPTKKERRELDAWHDSSK
jgi:ribosome-associated heat shock protein Hsp15